MSTHWSAAALFGYEFEIQDGKRKILCQTRDQSGRPCNSYVLDRNVPEMHILTIAMSSRPIDQVSDQSIHDLARLSTCEQHLNEPHKIAERWKNTLVEETKLRWKESRVQSQTLQKDNNALAAELEAKREDLRMMEGNAKALQVELTVAEGKQVAIEDELRVVEAELHGSSWGAIGKLFGN